MFKGAGWFGLLMCAGMGLEVRGYGLGSCAGMGEEGARVRGYGRGVVRGRAAETLLNPPLNQRWWEA